MQDQFSRTELLIGKEKLEKLRHSKVAVFGIGGVGSYTAEALARSGIGSFALIDDDTVCLTNINRQLIALQDTVGKQKTKVMKERILAINPKAQVETYDAFCLPENVTKLIQVDYDYIVDAIDTVSGKIAIAEQAHARNIPLISCMGAGNKMDATAFQVADIYDTSICPLCRVMRRELKKRNIPSLKVVYSKEKPAALADTGLKLCAEGCVCPPNAQRLCTSRRQIPGSISFVPSVAGLIAAGEVIKDIIQW